MIETTDHVVIRITCADEGEADRIAAALVERRLAACVHRLPVRSRYRWQGRMEQADEVVLVVTSTRRRSDDIAATVRELHSYEVPAVTWTALGGGTADYLAWIDESTR